ncbi:MULTISPECIES: phasin family protein [Cohnella]|mgnify:CR=1 FL=1|uniref:phasin family protein n=1 Tax=Cohnella TaxID=329857 RepID=UPI0009BB1233|nr:MULTISPECIES: hypothetical protein [Cohnella]MBN2980015.1 hypothetical protein [Cohnella algarum]
MKEALNKAFSLGLGVAAASKEQVEKLVDELVKKGEMSRAESFGFVDEWLQKGEESRRKLESYIQERIQTALGERNLATKADIERLERRLDELVAIAGGEKSGTETPGNDESV